MQAFNSGHWYGHSSVKAEKPFNQLGVSSDFKSLNQLPEIIGFLVNSSHVNAKSPSSGFTYSTEITFDISGPSKIFFWFQPALNTSTMCRLLVSWSIGHAVTMIPSPVVIITRDRLSQRLW
jgi:hypothetical protein